MQNISVHSPGKLMITGEYAVLFGAKSFSVPTYLGQSLTVLEKENANRKSIDWKSYEMDGVLWFESKFEIGDSVLKTDSQIAIKLQNLLKKLFELSTKFKSSSMGFEISSHLEFERNWGFGSSSSLISNLAKWAELSESQLFELFRETENGSGYDVFVSYFNSPLIYSLLNEMPVYKRMNWNPLFVPDLALVYSGNKQNSASEVERVKRSHLFTAEDVIELNHLTDLIVNSDSLLEFEEAICKHEVIIGRGIGQIPLKQQRYSDYLGEIKSLGAWGGDFFMATNFEFAKLYFGEKGFEVFRFNELVNLQGHSSTN